MQFNQRLRTITTLAFLYISIAISAQYSLDTIELRTTLIPLKTKEAGRNISIISNDALKNSSFTSLDDLIQKFPGIEMQTRNRFGAQADISMRGSTFPQVLVLVNGMKLNDPLTGHFSSYIPVSPGEIERIEILHGAASAIYGSDAVGGVINIITKTYSAPGIEKKTSSGEIDFGSNSLLSTNNNILIQKENYFFNAGINITKSDGEEIDSVRIKGNLLDSYNNYFNNQTLGLSAGIKLNQSYSLEARTSYDKRDFSARYFYTNSIFDKSKEKTTNTFNQIQLNRIGSNNSTHLKIAHRRGTDEFIFSPDFASTNSHTTHFINGQINHMQSFNDKLILNIGAQLDKRKIASTDRGDHDDLHSAVFLMLNFIPKSNVNLNASGRVDYDENYDLAFTPQLNASITKKHLTYRASVGKSIRGADYTERYVSFNLNNLTPGRSLGNPNLKAEEAFSEEIGIDYNPNKHLSLRSTFFARQSSNLIDYVSTNASEIENNQNLQPGENYFYAQNITAVSTHGLEIEIWNKFIKNSGIQIEGSLGYTYLNTSNDQETISVYISNHAKHLLSANAFLNSEHYGVSVSTLWKLRDEKLSESLGQVVNSTFNSWDIKTYYSPLSNIQFQFKAFNILDQKNQDILGAALPGRWLAFGIKYEI